MGEHIGIGVLDNDIWSARSIAQWIDGSSPRFHVAWTCTSAARALHRCLYERTRPQVPILDMALDGVSGIDVCRTIRQRTADVGIIGITAYDPERYRDDLAAAGAQALVAKERLACEAGAVIADVARGVVPEPETFMDAGTAHRELSRTLDARPAMPTEREVQVLRLYDRGYTTKEISRQLGISSSSVFTYVRRTAAKLGTSNRAETIRACKRLDLI